VRTIFVDRSNRKPICLGQGDCLILFDLKSKAGQRNYRRCHAKIVRAASDLTMLRLLTWACSRSLFARGSFDNSGGAIVFRQSNPYSKWLLPIKATSFLGQDIHSAPSLFLHQ
jgi:hypothetical protein